MPFSMNIELDIMALTTAVTKINERKTHNNNTFFLFFLIICHTHLFAFSKARAKVNSPSSLISLLNLTSKSLKRL